MPTPKSRPHDPAVAPDGSLWYTGQAANKLGSLDPATQKFDSHRQRAFSLVNSSQVRTALQLGKEPRRLREKYGMTLFGQGCLQARRLVEAGCRFVTVVWDEFGQLNAAWDTHLDHYNRLKQDLLPGLDWALSALGRIAAPNPPRRSINLHIS